MARLDHGRDIIGQITDLAVEKEIETGFLNAIGALSRAELGYYDQAPQKYVKIQIGEAVKWPPVGNISLRDGQAFVHAHAVLSDREGRVWGGHLTSGPVFAAELYVQELLGPHLQESA